MSGSRRHERLGGLLLEEISRAACRVVKDPRIQGVTFTTVKVSKDLRRARVFYSVLGGTQVQARAQRGLQSAKGVIKREIGRHLQLRYVPDIEFSFDDSFEYAQRIENLLKQIHRSES